jgi:hypothetical protein
MDQEQLVRLGRTVNEQAKHLEILYQKNIDFLAHITALRATNQIIMEMLLSQLPHQKDAIAQMLDQILARPDISTIFAGNQHCIDILQGVAEIARNPSRDSPEGRRAWLHLVPHHEQDKPEP